MQYKYIRFLLKRLLLAMLVFPVLAIPQETAQRLLPSIFLLLSDDLPISQCRETLLREWSVDFPYPQPAPRGGTWLTQYNNKLYFVIRNKLAITDGTPLGTKLVQNGEFNHISLLTVVDQKLFFVADNGISGEELWVIDHGADDVVPELVKDITVGSAGSDISDMLAFGAKLYFLTNGSNDPDVQDEGLWESDGTSIGTKLVKDFNSDSNASVFANVGYGRKNNRLMAVLNNQILFTANGNSDDREPWISDGSADGTQKFIDLNSGNPQCCGSSAPERYHAVSGGIYFVAAGSLGKELYFYDGNDVALVKDINQGPSGSVPEAQVDPDVTNFFIPLDGNRALFNARDGVSDELWVTQANDPSTVKISNLYTGVGDSRSFIRSGVTFGDHVYFNATNNEYGNELWVTDGSVMGTMLFRDFIANGSSNPDHFVANSDFLFFEASTLDGVNRSQRQFVVMDEMGNIRRFEGLIGNPGSGDVVFNLDGQIILFRGPLSGLWRLTCPVNLQ